MKSLSSGGIDAPHGLRQHDEPEALPARQAERPRGRLLARVDRVDARSVHLGHVGRIHQGQRDHRPEELVVGHPRDAQRRDPEAEQEDDQQARDGPEHVDVDRRDQAQREQHRAGQAAQDGQHEAEHQDQRLGDQEQPDVDPELGDQLGQRLPEDRPVEERLLEPRPARGVDDDVADDAEHDDGRQARDGQRASALGAQPEAGPPRAAGRDLPRPPPGPHPGPWVRAGRRGRSPGRAATAWRARRASRPRPAGRSRRSRTRSAGCPCPAPTPKCSPAAESANWPTMIPSPSCTPAT